MQAEELVKFNLMQIWIQCHGSPMVTPSLNNILFIKKKNKNEKDVCMHGNVYKRRNKRLWRAISTSFGGC